MGVYDGYFPLGLGTSRFPISGPDDKAGIEKSVALVSRALDLGLNYVDTAYTYSAGMAQTVLKEAFAGAKKPYGVTVKVMRDMDETADDARRRVELQLTAMGLDKARFFNCWTIFTYEGFESVMQKGGIYEGALRMKDEGIVDHICFSAHAQPDVIIRILESGAFEGVTVSYSMINAFVMRPVLDAALARGVDVAVMNPLGGGIIAQNPDFFDFARGARDENAIQAAMRFAKAHPAVKIVLSGVSSKEELDENFRVFTEDGGAPDTAWTKRVMEGVGALRGFCTGCNYCAGCPADIPIAEIMRKRNSLLFDQSAAYNRTEPELVKNIRLFYAHVSADEWFPDSPENPCVRCGQCEAKCTQKLGIIDAVDDMYARADKVGFSLSAHRARLEELLHDKGYTKVGLYPNGGFANLIREQYGRFFGEPDFEWLQFNSDPKMWGQTSGDLPVHAPAEIPKRKPDVIVICTYKYDKDIYESLKHYEDEGIKVVKLHQDTDVPWVF